MRACNRLGVLVDVSHLNDRAFRGVANITAEPVVATHLAVHAICPLSRNLTDWQLDAIGDSSGIVGITSTVSATRPDGWDERDTPLTGIADHIDYIIRRIGIDRVGFGSDFDGAAMPDGLHDAAGLPNLIATLRERGYTEPEIVRLAHGNWERVLAATWKG